MELIPLYILIFEVILLIFADHYLFHSRLTPSIILMVPYLFVVLITIIFGNRLELVSFNYSSLYIWILGIIPFWIGGVFIRLLFRNQLPQKDPVSELHFPQWVFNIFVFVVLLLFVKFLLTGKNGYAFGSKEFGEAFIGSGIFGHLSNLLFVIFPYFVVHKKKTVLIYVLMILILVMVLSYWSKTWFLSMILTAFLISIYFKRIRLSPLTIILPLLIGILFFVLFYSFSIKDNLMAFAARHFIDYLTSGILPLSEYMKYNHFTEISPQYVFSPFINLYHSLTGGELVGAHSELWITTDVLSNFESNVFTFFGTIYIYSGIYYGIIFSFILGLINYLLLYLTKSRNSFFIATAYFNSIAVLSWGWFNCSFVLLRSWEILLLASFMYFLAQHNIKISGTRITISKPLV
ncbi:MAG: oligosaccharide repeat unit polymerase [Bacteroidales bacterium]|nr:oligosaccharide repeat unit polymerase [Bacteroidales bacterium]